MRVGVVGCVWTAVWREGEGREEGVRVGGSIWTEANVVRDGDGREVGEEEGCRVWGETTVLGDAGRC